MESHYEINYLVYYNEIRIQVINHFLKRSYIRCIPINESDQILDSIVTTYKSINKIIKSIDENNAFIYLKFDNDKLLFLEDPYYEYNLINYKTIYEFEEMMRHEQYAIKFIQWQQYLLIHVIDKFNLKCYMNATPINYFTQTFHKRIIELIYTEYPVFIKKPTIGSNSLYMLYPEHPITVKLNEMTNNIFIDNMIKWYRERYNNDNNNTYSNLDMIFDYYLELPKNNF